MAPQKPRARVYIDGFNLYHQRLKANPHLRWLDIVKLTELVLNDYEIELVKYFTAQIRRNISSDPRTPSRQQAYLRALSTLNRVDIIHGSFRKYVQSLPLHPLVLDSLTAKPVMSRVSLAVEKGSDVNLAAHMVFDSLTAHCDAFFVLTNDSDQLGALSLISETFTGTTGIIFPQGQGRENKAFRGIADLQRLSISDENLFCSQLPDVIDDLHGKVTRPTTWS